MLETRQIIGLSDSEAGEEIFYSFNPATQSNNNDSFFKATPRQIDEAVTKASNASRTFRLKSGAEKANFLLAIAEEILSIGDTLITVCASETGLPLLRIEGERGRTVNQLKMFAALLKEGSWVDARIDTAIPDRTPLPKPDIRSMHIPLGPVAVFGASNFPLAFSVAGGDTASALAAGCPVIVKGHPAHPATSALVGKAIQIAARKLNMPDGVFSLLFDNSIDVGVQLVQHPLIKAVAFTGSYKGGKALFDLAVKRTVPIPVYAEMGSTNPVFILPQAMRDRGPQIAAGYAASVTVGVGQFCTNPGLLISEGLIGDFEKSLQSEFEKTTGGVMLTPSILKAYRSGVEQNMSIGGVNQLAIAVGDSQAESNTAIPVLMKAEIDVFRNNHGLSEEVFGPAAIFVPTNTKKELLEIAENLSGHLTATVHGTDEELATYKDLLDILIDKVGRLVINGFPTGVEVCSSMVHGGTFPSTTDSRTTSVGTAAIYRFTRPVCYQNLPQQLLPEELKDQNALRISRIVNGERSNQ